MGKIMGNRTRVLRLLIAVPLVLAGLALGAPVSASAPYACTGYVEHIRIKTDVVVPGGQACILFDVTVRGGVTIEAGGDFRAIATEIRGPVAGAGIGVLEIAGGVVRGDVTVAVSTSVFIDEVVVRGDVALSGASDNAQLSSSTVRGRVTFADNAAAYIMDNTIGTDLACSGNGSVTNLDLPNTVGGTVSPDCAALVAP